ncbi:MAG: outer membrane protein transport protein [Lentisphaerae bacterium]|nr:outer membrane protein transport protein [Lentisphaerota bacterium]
MKHAPYTIVILLVTLTAVAWADGFRNPPEGAAVLGRAGMRLTEINDASAVVHNPAGLMDLDKAEVMTAATIAYSDVTFTDALTGNATESEDPWRILPALFGAWPVHNGRTVVGLGIHFPYGQFTRWDKDSLLKGRAPYDAQMTTLDITPAVATRVGDDLMVGAGIDLIWSEIKFKQVFPFSVMFADPAAPDGTLKACGDGYAVGAHAGLTWNLSECQRIAVIYRSPFSVDYDGDFDIVGGVPPAMLPPPVSASSDFDSEIDFPSVVAAGYGIRPTDRLRLEANVEWVEHSRNESMVTDVGGNNILVNPPTVPDPLAPSVAPQDWDDTWTFGLGLDWQCSAAWSVQAGWTYLPTPVPESTLSPTLSEEDKHIFGIGCSYRRGAHRFEAAYAYNLADDRTVDDPLNPVNGTYEYESHLFGASYACTF